MGPPIDKITLKGFKSIRSLEDFPLRRLNVLIGANGAGKSNFVSFFAFVREAIQGRLNHYVAKKGGADAHLFMGPKTTSHIRARLDLQPTGYEFSLEPTADDAFVFSDERIGGSLVGGEGGTCSFGHGHRESALKDELERVVDSRDMRNIYDSISGYVTYHLHDTSDKAAMRRSGTSRDTEYLRFDASNLAAFLCLIRSQYQDAYDGIRDAIRLAAPFFDDFKLRPKAANGDEMLQLEWTQKGSDYPFHVNQLSDGTLRFIALATALLQPNPPATMLFDEPELGLHPYALNLFAALVKKAATRTQIIVSTQSAPLLDNFAAEDIIVVDRQGDESTFRRLVSDELSEWLKDYSLGELWQKNVLGGRPADD